MILLALIPAFLMINMLYGPDRFVGDDGPAYERLGYEASMDPSVFDKDNFYHCYWSPAWVGTIGSLYRWTGRNPLMVRLLSLYAATICALILYSTGRRFSEEVGLLSCILYLATPEIRQYSMSLSYEIPAATLLMGAAWLITFCRRMRIFAGGGHPCSSPGSW